MKRIFFNHRKIYLRFRRLSMLLYLGAWCVFVFTPHGAHAQTSEPTVSPAIAAKLTKLYQQVGSSFWRGEYGQRVYIDGGEDWRTLLSTPLPKGGSSWKEYSRAAQAGDEWLKLADENHIHNWMSDTVIYLDALSYYTLGNYARATALFNRLPHDYLRYRYLSDSNNRDPDYANPSWPGISKLLFFARLQTFSNKPANTFAALKQITADALTTLAAQRAFAALIASHSTRYNTYEFREEFFGGDRYGGEPDQWRAAALPPTLALVQQAWDTFLPLAAKQAGGKAVRTWLQTLAKPGGLLETVAALRLDEFTTVLTAQLKKDAAAALAAKQYDRAKILLVQLRTEYSDDTAIATYTAAGLDQVAQGFTAQADATFDLRALKPQTAAYAAYQKLLASTDDAALKGYAQFRMADALGTMGKYAEGIAHLQQAINIWNVIPPQERPLQPGNYDRPQATHGAAPQYYIEEAYYYLGYYTGAGLKQRDKGIALHREFLEKFPGSKWSGEALYDMLLWYRWSRRPKEAAAVAKELAARFPHSVRGATARDLLKTEYAKY
jgi:hypothetical protein